MKILMVADKPNTAIDRLCKYTIRTNPHHQFSLVYVHPKRPSAEQLDAFSNGKEWCDLVDFRYWKSAELVKSMFYLNRPALLTHYNPYDVDKSDWSDYKTNVVVNTEQLSKIRCKATLIGLPVDIFFWDYLSDTEYKELFRSSEPKSVIMVANRIEAKKGILPVATACRDLGIKFTLVGSPSDPAYLAQVLELDNVSYFEAVSDDELKELYYKSTIHVCNSIDNFESGTMPVLESMSVGLPVLTRKVGHVQDIYNGVNMVIQKSDPTDVDEIKTQLKAMLEDVDWLIKLRQDAWQTIKNRNIEVYGRQYSKLYQDILSEKELISIIIPTADRPEVLLKTLAHIIATQSEKLEIIVVDDGEEKCAQTEQVVDAARLNNKLTFKYFKSAQYQNSRKVYGIARARNIGIQEAEGDWLMFVDDRHAIEPEAINAFYERRSAGTWLWGIKDNFKKGFVENFSFIDRRSIIKIGMFNTLIGQYGGMTQDIRSRAELSQIKFEFVENAKASTLIKSSARHHSKIDIAKSKIQCYKLYGER